MMRCDSTQLGRAFVVVAALFLTAVAVRAQVPKAATVRPAGNTNSPSAPAQAKSPKIPRTLDGKPDLQGLWSFSILTPLQRPGGLYKETYSEDEAGNLEEQAQQRQIDLRVEPTVTPPGEKTTDAYNTFWRDGYFS